MAEKSGPSALERLPDRLDVPLLVLAGVSVGLYLCDLQGVWYRRGLEAAYARVSLGIDLLFVADLLFKGVVLGRPYLRTPWFFIDLLSCLPALAWATAGTSFLHSARFARGFRLFRLLRSLRALRALRAIRPLAHLRQAAPGASPDEERAFNRALTVAVALFTAILLGAMLHVQKSAVSGRVLALESVEAGALRARVWKRGMERTVLIEGSRAVRTEEELEFYVVLGAILGFALVLGVVKYQLPDVATGQLRSLLNIALPHQVADHFVKHPEAYDRTVRMPATIVFADLRGFSATVEGLGTDLDLLKSHLERALDAVVDVHRRHDLIVDKFIGDAVMSFRGGELVEGDAGEHAYRVVRASLDTMKAVRELRDPYFKGIKIGGASAPDCLIGTFGTSKRLTYTILGDAVNVAARLEPASGVCGAGNLFCDRTRGLASGRSDVAWRRFGTLRVKGRAGEVGVNEAFDAAELGDRGWIQRFEGALKDFEAGGFEAARRGFEAADRARPGGDAPSKYYLKLLEPLLAEGAPPDWRPVIGRGVELPK